MHIHIYIYTPEKGGDESQPPTQCSRFFVSALKYLEVKAGREIEKERERERGERERERDREMYRQGGKEALRR